MFGARGNTESDESRQRFGGTGAGGRAVIGLLRSEGSQSSGGNEMRQKRGEASANSMPTSVFPPSFLPMKITVQGSSSVVRGFRSKSFCVRTTGACKRSKQPLALTETVCVFSSNEI